MTDNRERWLQSLRGTVSDRDHALLEKASRILTDNIYCDRDDLWYPYRCIHPFGGGPSRDKNPGIWNWDSAFHAIGALHFDVQLAREQLLGFLQYQLDNGMMIDVLWKSGDANRISSKPPLLAWAASKIYEADGDREFAAKVYPSLCREECFWRRERFYQGLFRYGADMNLICFDRVEEYVRYESGWDNSVRWDHACSDYWPIDLNCYVILMYRGLTVLAKALGRDMDAAVYGARAQALAEKINRLLWSDALGAYTDVDRFTGKASRVLTPASFMPLYIGIAPQEYARAMAAHGADPGKFYPGMPTVAYDDPAHCRDYWRGPTWLNVAYFAAKGLKDYGYRQTAEDIRQTILGWVEKDGSCIHENYDPTTGEGLCCAYFSWSCTFVMEFILHF